MAQRSSFAVFVLVLSLCLLPHVVSTAGVSDEAKVQASTAVIKEIMDIPECAIPPVFCATRRESRFFPIYSRRALFLEAVMESGYCWCAMRTNHGQPIFFRLIGGSFGWQIGVQSTDAILVLNSIRSLDAICSGKFTLGADASIAAGPVGRQAEAGTDILLRRRYSPTPETGASFWDFRLKGRNSGRLRCDCGLL